MPAPSVSPPDPSGDPATDPSIPSLTDAERAGRRLRLFLRQTKDFRLQRDLRNNDFRLHPEARLRRLAEELAGYRQMVRAGHLEVRSDEGRVLNSMGLARMDSGDARAARRDFEEALTIARETNDRRREGNALGNLGNAYASLGDTRKAIEFYEQRLVIAREIGDRRGEGNALWNSAIRHWEFGECKEAISRATSALSIFKAIESPHIAKVQAALVRWHEAEA